MNKCDVNGCDNTCNINVTDTQRVCRYHFFHPPFEKIEAIPPSVLDAERVETYLFHMRDIRWEQ